MRGVILAGALVLALWPSGIGAQQTTSFGGSAETPATGSPPQFNPVTLRCENTPPPTVPGNWLVSAPRGIPGPTRPGDLVEIGLWARDGQPEPSYYVGARVIAPDG